MHTTHLAMRLAAWFVTFLSLLLGCWSMRLELKDSWPWILLASLMPLIMVVLANGRGPLRLRKRMKYHGVDILPTPGIKDTIHIGSHLLAAMCEATGAFELTTERDYTKKRYTTHLILTPTEATLQWIATRSDRFDLPCRSIPPTLIPPADWSPGHAPVDITIALAGTLPLVRHVSPAQALKLSSVSDAISLLCAQCLAADGLAGQ